MPGTRGGRTNSLRPVGVTAVAGKSAATRDTAIAVSLAAVERRLDRVSSLRTDGMIVVDAFLRDGGRDDAAAPRPDDADRAVGTRLVAPLDEHAVRRRDVERVRRIAEIVGAERALRRAIRRHVERQLVVGRDLVGRGVGPGG